MIWTLAAMTSNTLMGVSGVGKIWIAPIVNVYLAMGIEFTNKDLAASRQYAPFVQPKYLIDKGLELTYNEKGDFYRYKNVNTNIIYLLKIITEKENFKKCLEEEDAVVVYSGHARYGRGPCFGDSPAPGQAWGDGDNHTGIYYMAYRYLGVPIAEILHHKYKAWLVPDKQPLDKLSNLHPWIRKSKFVKIAIGDIIRKLSNIKKVLSGINREYIYISDDLADIKKIEPSELMNYVPGSHHPEQKYWCYKSKRKYKYRNLRNNKIVSRECTIISVVLQADWEKTKSEPLDLGKTTIKCRVFCHFGCNTLIHHRKILRQRKGWRFNGNGQYSFMTTKETYEIDPYWLYNFMTGPHDSIRQNLIFACNKTNKDLYNLQKKPGIKKNNYDYRIKFVKNIQQNDKRGHDLCKGCGERSCKL